MRGRILARFVPEGTELAGLDYPVIANLPKIYKKRHPNHGFEGLAISPDERLLYLLMEGPLEVAHDAPSSR